MEIIIDPVLCLCKDINSILPYKKGIISDWCRIESFIICTMFLEVVETEHHIT